jgi:acetyltransferase-like isoleucine patch superfamily enzyme
LKGVEISKGAVIGAGAVVTKNISEYGVAVGNPAKVIKYRK